MTELSHIHAAISIHAPRLANIGQPLITPLLLVGVAVVVHLRFEEPVRRGLRQWFAKGTC
jgi:hypothetical protein